MKVSVTLSGADLRFLDEYARAQGVSRSGAVHRAVQLLRRVSLGASYEAAWAEWADGEADVWETTAQPLMFLDFRPGT